MKRTQLATLPHPLKWGLAVTLLATVASLLWPTRAVVDVQYRAGAVADAPRRQASPSVRPGAKDGALARFQPPANATAASAATSSSFDPFVGLVPLSPPAPPPVAAPVAIAPTPAPPPQDYRFLGRITAPDGIEQFLLGHGDAVVPVKVGMTLDNGYVVESISPDAIALVYPPMSIKAAVPIPKSE